MTTISTLGSLLAASASLSTQQQQLNLLSQQLGTGKKAVDLSDYAPNEARQLMDFSNAVTQRQSYISVMKIVNARLSIYDQTMTDMEKQTQNAISAIQAAPTLEEAGVTGLRQQIINAIQNVQGDLNQQLGGRYIYAGSRYTTEPVGDIQSLALPPTDSSTPVSSPVLPSYDTEAPDNNKPEAWAQDSVNVDTGNTLTYGVTSTNPAFQQMILGLRWALAATEETDDADYKTDIANAQALLSAAQNGTTSLTAVHTAVAGAQNTISQALTSQQQFIDNLKNQISNIQQVDVSTIAAQITALQTQLQASYSVTAGLLKNTILDYLS